MTRADFYKWINFHNFERKSKNMIIEEKIKTTTFGELNDGDIYRYGSIYFLKIPRCFVGKY